MLSLPLSLSLSCSFLIWNISNSSLVLFHSWKKCEFMIEKMNCGDKDSFPIWGSPQEVAILEKQNCRIGRKNPIHPTEGLNHFYNIQLFLDRQQEMNTYVVWGWHLPTFAWGERSVYLNCRDSPRFGEAFSAHPFNYRTFTACTPLLRKHGKLAWHRSNVSNDVLALASILKLGFCKGCKSPEEMLEHRRPAYHGLH